MMFADLVDLEDLRLQLRELGLDVPAGSSPEDCASVVKAAMPVDGLPEVIGALSGADVSLHPDVRRVIELILMS